MNTIHYLTILSIRVGGIFEDPLMDEAMRMLRGDYAAALMENPNRAIAKKRYAEASVRSTPFGRAVFDETRWRMEAQRKMGVNLTAWQFSGRWPTVFEVSDDVEDAVRLTPYDNVFPALCVAARKRDILLDPKRLNELAERAGAFMDGGTIDGIVRRANFTSKNRWMDAFKFFIQTKDADHVLVGIDCLL